MMAERVGGISHSGQPVPLIAKLAFSAWMLFWVTVILIHRGPQNFLWLCNMAQFILLYVMWRPNRLLLASQVGVISLVGLVWTLDLLVGLARGGESLTGFTAYMFDEELALIVRVTSLYHVGVPLLMLWLVSRLGYDSRGPWLQCGIGVIGVVGAWLFTEPHRNINWVYQPFGVEQTWMPEPLWVLVLIVAYPVVLYFPGHFLVRWVHKR